LSIGHQHTFRSFIRTPRTELDLSEGALWAGLSNRSCVPFIRWFEMDV